MPKPPRIPSLTSIRGLAAWWVVAYHFREYLPLSPHSGVIEFVERGHYAVDLFFMLSGFVLQMNYGNALFADGLNFRNLGSFSIARFARIYPLHLFMMIIFIANPLALTLFSAHVGDSVLSYRYGPSDYILGLFLLQNWGFCDRLTWNIPAWSISTEFAAYILFPVASYLTLRFVRRQVSAIIIMICVLLCLCLFLRLTDTANLNDDIPKLGLMRCICEFLSGVILYRVTELLDVSKRRGWLLLGLLLSPIMFWIAGAPEYFSVFPICLALVLLAASPYGFVSFALAWKPLWYLGEISYSTYMVHFFVKDWVKFILVDHLGEKSWAIFAIFIAATAALSVVLYLHIEIPWKERILKIGMPIGRRRVAQSS
jgi:peptidoglycan/LPS O-acetylase OafA/YrhL